MNAKFPLQKYVSNLQTFLNAFEPNEIEPPQSIAFSSSGAAKILGLQWHPAEDEFRIKFKSTGISQIKLTKRVASSLIASVYDPLGLVQPILVRGKILLQDLWREGLQWDDPIPEHIEKRFRDYYANLDNLFAIHVQRPYSLSNPDKFDLFGFSDASATAYGAVVYVKSYSSSSVEVTIACSCRASNC